MSLTQKDFDQIDQLLEEKFDERLKILPTKDEFFSKMDEAMGELKIIREEQEIISHTVSNHENRLQNLEKIHPEVIS
jgi:predicted nuclease with TOPRIM domain